MWSRLLALALLLLPAAALADVKEKVAALAPSGLVLVVDGEGNELVAQNADEPFVPASVTEDRHGLAGAGGAGRRLSLRDPLHLDDKRVLYVRGGGDPFLISEELAGACDQSGRSGRQEADHRHRARRQLLPFQPSHPGHRGNR